MDIGMNIGRLLVALPRKIGPQSRLLFRDPKRFIENLNDLIHPDWLQQKMLGLEEMRPMHVRIDGGNAATPHLNVLLPALGQRLTGGPNTAINIAIRVAEAGIPVRLLMTDGGIPADTNALWRHIASITGQGQARPNITFGSTTDPASPAALGARDVFLATYWTTAFRLKSVLPSMKVREFIYLIQDFEPGLYPWSSRYAQALETYSMQFRALINERFLADHMTENRIGRFADPGFISRCSVFEPAVDRRLFYSIETTGSPRQLLFYARPSEFRNLYGIGFEALRAATNHPLFAHANWRFVAIGSSESRGKSGTFGTALGGRLPLSGAQFLYAAPWLTYEDYARTIRESDILLSLMLSPHTSYPVLEMAACGKIAVTNTFGSKTEERLTAISTNIIAVSPTVEAIRDGLISAAARLASGSTASPDIALPSDWHTTLRDTVVATREMFREAVQAAI
jgi:O-antigen biosynthesis protein